MAFDEGAQVQMLAIGDDTPTHYGLLAAPVLTQWKAVRIALVNLWRADDEASKRDATSLNGCLEKLSSSLLQGRRMQKHHDALLKNANDLMKNTQAEMMGLLG